VTTQQAIEVPVRKSITVKASVEHTFQMFTDGIDSWWPREHHLGNAPMKREIIEGRVGGRCYSEQHDGTEWPWATVLVWEPPRRLVLAWQINPAWKFEPDLEKTSEVEVRFTPEADGSTRVDLEHRQFERHGAGWEGARSGVDTGMGWGWILAQFAARTEENAQGAPTA